MESCFKNIKNAMKALTNKVKSAYSMAKRFVKIHSVHMQVQNQHSVVQVLNKNSNWKNKVIFSPFDVQNWIQQHQQRVQNMGIGKEGSRICKF